MCFTPTNFLFHFRDLFWVKTAFVRLESLTLHLELEEERREEAKGEKSRIQQERQGFASGIHRE